MESIFVSSVARGEMTAIRQAARRSVESLEMRAVMFETLPASEEGSRRALLDRLARCDAVLLILGASYGEPGEQGLSPTEEEFEEARTRGIPILALVQSVAREPAQESFVKRVRGTWEEGRFAPTFRDETDVGFAAVSALNDWRSRKRDSGSVEESCGRALALARGDERPGYVRSGSKLRVVTLPDTTRPLLDALAMDDASLPDDLATSARSSKLVSNDQAIAASVTAEGIFLRVDGGRGFEDIQLFVGMDGAIVAEGAVGGESMAFGGSVVLADRVRKVMEAAIRFALAAWDRIDRRDEIRQLLLVAAVPDAEHKVYALTDPTNSMHIPMGLPSTIVAPEPPLHVRRADLGRTETLDRLQAELKRVFTLGGGLFPRG